MQGRLNGSSRPEMSRTGSVLSDLSAEKDSTNWKLDYEETSTFLIPELASYQESQETESKSTRWTDEKHSMYLKSIEASFVNDLYNSVATLGDCSQQEYTSESKLSRQNPNGFPTPSGQFKVLKNGSWARVNFRHFRREIPRLKRSHESNPILANPWIQRYSRHQTRISPTLQGQAPVSTTVDPSAFQFGCQDSIDINSEVTDQNFVDEVSDEEKSSRKRRQKSRKTSATACSCNDQVVPLARLSLTDKIAEVHGSQKSRNSE